MANERNHRTEIVTANGEAIAEAAAILRAGGLVAMPTETVYGLAADATYDRAVAAIYAAKGRPAFNPLIAHVLDSEAATREAVFDANARALAQAFWPGPLTIVAPIGAARPHQRTRPRRTRQRRVARARPSGRPRADRGGGRPPRRALGQPVRPRQPDLGRSRPGRSRRAHRSFDAGRRG